MSGKIRELSERLLDFIKRAILFVIKWRYLIALVVFVFCVIFKVHGSSINEYNKMFANYGEYVSQSVILGKSRAIRSDEWRVHTPYYMSQAYNDYAKNSNQMSLEGQDMIVGYNAPVADISLIAKPFTWGYVLLGNEYGLSWYWCSKLILLVLVAFEVCMVVTQKNKKVSLLGAIMIAFAPAVQWWFVPHMVDVFFWGMAVFVLAYHFFMSGKKMKALYMILLPMSVVTFVLALFPSLQIPVGLTMLVLFIACMIRDKKEITFKKRDIWQLIVMAVFALVVLGYTLWTSKEAIMLLYNTVYPGKRVSVGGNYGIDALFTNLTTFFLPFKDITYLNNSEVSTFIQFAPILLMVYPIIWKKMKKDKNMIVGNTLLTVVIVMIVFMLAGFPELLAKLTMFSYVNRMDIAYGLVATIFTVWGIDMIWRKQIITRKQALIVIAVFGFLYICFVGKNELSYMGWKYYLAVIAGLMALGYLIMRRYQKTSLVGVAALVMVSGATVNPVAVGVAPLFNHPFEKKIREIVSEDNEAYWLALEGVDMQQLAMANGARVLNAVNFYPDYQKWELIDPERKNDDIYNRYAHITINTSPEETKLTLTSSPDWIDVKISCEDLDKWPVKYLIKGGELDACGERFEEIYKDSESEYYIYKRKDE